MIVSASLMGRLLFSLEWCRMLPCDAPSVHYGQADENMGVFLALKEKCYAMGWAGGHRAQPYSCCFPSVQVGKEVLASPGLVRLCQSEGWNEKGTGLSTTSHCQFFLPFLLFLFNILYQMSAEFWLVIQNPGGSQLLLGLGEVKDWGAKCLSLLRCRDDVSI